MDKAMMLLLQRASRKGADGMQAGSSRGGPSSAGHSVSIELIDAPGNKVVNDAEKVVHDPVVADVNPRKRNRREIEEENIGGDDIVENITVGGGINKTITFIGSRALITNTIDPRSRKEVMRAEIQPSERWTGGSTVPLRVFKLVQLSQDSVAYTGRRRDELADRCKGRIGRFLSDFMHVLDEYQSDDESEVRSKLEVEVSALKGEKKRLGSSCLDLEKKVSDLSSTNTTMSKRVTELESIEKSSNKKILELEGRLRDVESERDELKVKCEGLDRQVGGMDQSYKLIMEENATLKAEVEKAVEDIANALGDGYGRCVTRMKNAGFDTSGHSFEDYIRELAASRPDDPTGGS
ncbi:uncharacterized protein LOC141702423 [Apium graveolens]|uniref:uncharacterized protein LOC141702423 n=1 Tax=Apium graveolens TaxID=4045 RepID=UPI003D79DF5C